jgi:hypothetical protein
VFARQENLRAQNSSLFFVWLSEEDKTIISKKNNIDNELKWRPIMSLQSLQRSLT